MQADRNFWRARPAGRGSRELASPAVPDPQCRPGPRHPRHRRRGGLGDGLVHRDGAVVVPSVVYYRTCPLYAVRDDLTASGFTVTTVPLTTLGQRADGSPRYRLVLARRPA